MRFLQSLSAWAVLQRDTIRCALLLITAVAVKGNGRARAEVLRFAKSLRAARGLLEVRSCAKKSLERGRKPYAE